AADVPDVDAVIPQPDEQEAVTLIRVVDERRARDLDERLLRCRRRAEIDDDETRRSARRSWIDAEKCVELAVHASKLRRVDAAGSLVVRESAQQLRLARIRKVVDSNRSRARFRRDDE